MAAVYERCVLKQLRPASFPELQQLNCLEYLHHRSDTATQSAAMCSFSTGLGKEGEEFLRAAEQALSSELEVKKDEDQNMTKMMDVLKKAIEQDVPARTPAYSQFMRALDEDKGTLQADYDKCHGRTDKAAFRKRWAAQKLEAIKEKYSQSEVLKVIDWSKTTYRGD